jgi:hypothetical protein
MKASEQGQMTTDMLCSLIQPELHVKGMFVQSISIKYCLYQDACLFL